MSISFSYSLIKQTIHFTRDINFAGTHLSSKNILMIKAVSTTDQKYNLESEVNIIESMHNLDFAKTLSFVEPFLALLEDMKLHLDTVNFEVPLFNLFPELKDKIKKLPTNCLYALENLFLPLIKDQLINENNLSIESNGLYIPSLDDHLKIDSILKDYEKYNYLKVKIGRLPLTYELDLLKKLIDQSSNKLKLRLDANLSLDVSKLSLYTKTLPMDRIEYFEEPYIGSHKDIRNTNIAVDESLEDILETNIIPQSVTAIVQKPSVRLAISGTIKLINEISKKKVIPVVISSCFESYEGYYGLIILAAYSNKMTVTGHGLDTYRYLKQENKTPLIFDNKNITCP